MEFQDHYATLGVAHNATQSDIKKAYRKLARRHHPDVSQEPGAKARFQEVALAHGVLNDVEQRAAYDALVLRKAQGQDFEAGSRWGQGNPFSRGAAQGRARGRPQDADVGDLWGSLFGHDEGQAQGRSNQSRSSRRPNAGPQHGQDQHARVSIDLLDSYLGATRTLAWPQPGAQANGQHASAERHLEVRIPKGVRPGQQVRLAGQGAPGSDGAAAGDLYLEVDFHPHPVFQVDGRDVRFELPVSPWEAALGATITAPTPDGSVELTIPAGSVQGRTLRLTGKGLPGQPPGDLYAVLTIAMPAADSDSTKAAYQAMALTFPDYRPRASISA